MIIRYSYLHNGRWSDIPEHVAKRDPRGRPVLTMPRNARLMRVAVQSAKGVWQDRTRNADTPIYLPRKSW